ncbi:MAG: DUF3078 domain-containing protein [Prolixibacteraceae bacterium]
MTFKKYYYTLVISVVFAMQLSASASGFSVAAERKSKNTASVHDTLSWSVSLIKKIFSGSGEWFMTRESYQKSIRGIVDYSENESIDTIVVNMNHLLGNDSIPLIFNRKAENIPNKRLVPGYLSADEVDRLTESRRIAVADSARKTLITVPDYYLSEGLAKAPVLPPGDPQQMMVSMDRNLPGAFRNKFYKGWANIKLPANVTAAEIDTLKAKLFVWTLQSYNDSILFYHRDSLMQQYRDNIVNQISGDAASRKKSFLTTRNREFLNIFNESEIRKVNDSIRMALRYLTDRAAADSSLVTVSNAKGSQARIWTANHSMSSTRIFLKNEQNDSLSVILYNNGKGGLRLVIDDGVKFLRFTETQKKEITFNFKKPDGSLHKVNLRTIDPLPWKLFGTGTIGFTQTALSNWAKGGESSLSLLVIGRYMASYSKKNVKWENMAEFRLGTFTSKTRGIEKNDDKLEFQSRLGYSAFKKWYYSVESDFRTQMAKGFKFPDKTNPISTFMAPAYLTFSLGMDFKPNKNFSLFLSPITSKATFVRDTALINPVNYGLEHGKTRLWEPGMFVKMNWHYKIKDDMFYDTRAEIFNNYNYPFQKLNVDWEQTLVMQITQHINARINTQVIYDYNVKFPITDETGKVIEQKAKWQFKELFTLGFNYKF